jgi:molybdopterin converting factor small subunit
LLEDNTAVRLKTVVYRVEPMSVKINIHPSLLHVTDNQEIVEVSGNTVGQCFEQLVKKFPDLKEWLYEKDGKLSKYIDVFVNQESAYPEELKKPVKDGDNLQIIMTIAGG